MIKLLNKFFKSGLLAFVLMIFYPVVFIFSQNVYYLESKEIVLPLFVLILSSLVIGVFIFLIIKELERTFLMTALLAVLFFLFSEIQLNLVIAALKLELKIPFYFTTDIAATAWFILVILVFYFVLFISKSNLQKLIKIVTLTFLFAWAFLLFGLLRMHSVESAPTDTEDLYSLSDKTFSKDELPDIYYIITDGHARSDILKDIYDVDNSEFINFLKEKDFFVAEDSYSNYCMTILSLASSLNLDYVKNESNFESEIKRPIQALRDSEFRSILEKLNYKIVSFNTGYSPTEINNPDLYLRVPGAITEFQGILLGTTPFEVLPVDLMSDIQINSHRNRILFTLKELPELAKKEGPKFVIAHMVSPHPPFIFDSKGKTTSENRFFSMKDAHDYRNIPGNSQETYISGYREQIKFFDKVLKDSLDQLLKNAKRPTVIILQSDHGPGAFHNHNDITQIYPPERYSILNAYYFSDKRYDQLSNDISPINTFRVILNNYMGYDLPLLENKNYFSTNIRPLLFTDITDRLIEYQNGREKE